MQDLDMDAKTIESKMFALTQTQREAIKELLKQIFKINAKKKLIIQMTKVSFNFAKLVWIVVTFIILIVINYERLKVNTRIENAAYVNGEVISLEESAKGTWFLNYRFIVNNQEYTGFVSSSFCDKCKCCKRGSIVRVRYDKYNSSNNDLVLENTPNR